MIFNMSTGGASTADKVKYNNTESGLKSTDVQGAIDEVNSSLNNYSDVLGLKEGQVIRRRTHVGNQLQCDVADGSIFRSSAITIDISDLGLNSLSTVNAHFIQTSPNSTSIIGISIYGQATKDTVKVIVWTPISKTIDSYGIDLECIGSII